MTISADSAAGERVKKKGVTIAGWFISWKIPLKWMMTGGTPILGNFHIMTINQWFVVGLADVDDD